MTMSSTETLIKRALLALVAVAAAACAAPAPDTDGGQLALEAGESPAVFTTYGYSTGTGPRPLLNDEAVGLWLGRADHDLDTAEAVTVVWKQGGGVAVITDWSEVAIAAGVFDVGKSALAIVGVEDAAPLVQTAGTIKLKVALARPVQSGAGLWLVLASHAPASGAWRPLGSVQAESVAAGLVIVNRIPGWRPSDQLGGGETPFDVAGAPRAVSAAVLVP